MRRFKWTLQLLRLYVSDNGLGWTLCFLARVVLRHLVDALSRHMSNLEEKRELPGEHSVAVNSLVWQTYNWEQGGEEWTWTSKWKQSLVNNVMLKYIEPGKTVLEIGPGAGRWTVVLQGIAKHLILVDLS